MDPVSIGLTIFATFKEVYLISKFVCKTISSVNNYKSDQHDLGTEFCQEFLLFRSLGRLFVLQNNGVFDDDNLNEVGQTSLSSLRLSSN